MSDNSTSGKSSPLPPPGLFQTQNLALPTGFSVPYSSQLNEDGTDSPHDGFSNYSSNIYFLIMFNH
jgi:hypothetical protein